MSDIINTEKNFTYSVSDPSQRKMLLLIGKALSSKERLQILHLLEYRPLTIREIAKELDLPLSSVAMHTNVLQSAQLIFIDYKPSPKGQLKLCSRSANKVTIHIENVSDVVTTKEKIYEMPVGNYVDFNISPPCGLAGANDAIGKYDEVHSFYLPERTSAELLWFQKGTVVYKFPGIEDESNVNEIAFSMELCSETLYSRDNWPSDITIWINEIEIATYTSPSDFGGRRGKYTPKWWFINSTQFGVLKTFSVSENGCFIDGVLTSNKITIKDLKLKEFPFIKLTIGIKEDAMHKGGINLFGRGFGDYKQAIIMKLIKK